MALIHFEQVSRTYHMGVNKVAALKSINLKISAGEFVAVTGPSGSGKTTLCNLVGALDRPNAGQLQVNGRALTEMDDDALSTHRSRSVGFVFQNFNLVNVLTALENVMLPMQLQGADQKKARTKAASMLDELGLSTHSGHLPDKLSGGQRQRVAIARALVTEPPIIVADEPTANLDTKNANRILELMRHYNEVKGSTFILSTHDPRMLNALPRVIQLQDGTVIDDSSN